MWSGAFFVSCEREKRRISETFREYRRMSENGIFKSIDQSLFVSNFALASLTIGYCECSLTYCYTGHGRQACANNN